MNAKAGKEKLFGYKELVVVVDVPTGMCSVLAQASAALKKTCNPLHQQIFWIPANIVHLAVLHTGRVREDLVSVVGDYVKKAVAEMPGFTIKVAGLKLYEDKPGGGEKAIKAIWAVVENHGRLTELRQKLVEELQEIDVQLDPDPFEAHVPLALVDQFRNTREFDSAFVEWHDHDFGTIKVDSLQLKVANPAEGTMDRPFSVARTISLAEEMVQEVPVDMDDDDDEEISVVAEVIDQGWPENEGDAAIVIEEEAEKVVIEEEAEEVVIEEKAEEVVIEEKAEEVVVEEEDDDVGPIEEVDLEPAIEEAVAEDGEEDDIVILADAEGEDEQDEQKED